MLFLPLPIRGDLYDVNQTFLLLQISQVCSWHIGKLEKQFQIVFPRKFSKNLSILGKRAFSQRCKTHSKVVEQGSSQQCQFK